ncbi:MAG: alpha-amylase family glycosyl hydrolase [Bacteroidales bacterium]|nr:alpha-amylase family glycosyl hydrolase [Bacteroidales bacterium]
MKKVSILACVACLAVSGSLGSCRSAPGSDPAPQEKTTEAPFLWENANIYFLLTDRFYNGDTSNDIQFDRSGKTAMLRGFEGGDIKGVIQKMEEGYFDRLGITALWMTPWLEQIHGGTNEGTGLTYGFHGYWISDWTSLDPNFGTEEDLARLVETAHKQGIRVVMDVIINHTGPVTEQDPVWPGEWVRTEPRCTYQDYESTVTCTLVRNLPDIRTESDQEVELPPQLIEKWTREGRLEQEMEELDAFFARTGYPRAPRYYLIKWLTDFVRKYGIDGYRLDTAKHIEEHIWSELGKEAQAALEEWKEAHPGQVLDDRDFYMVGEVYGYGISGGRLFDFGDRQVDFFAQDLDALINFEFKESAKLPYEQLFSSYSNKLHGPLLGCSVLNYISSHDDGAPFDKKRSKSMEAGTKLLLAPGASQVYYGDESSRELEIPGTQGDANMRSFMNWEEIESNVSRKGVPIAEVMLHYQKLGQFRRAHPAVGAGEHRMISETPYIFSRIYEGADFSDRVVAGLDLKPGKKQIELNGLFDEGSILKDYYSGEKAAVREGHVELDTPHDIVLLGL